jgi:hypothetical protein
MKTKIPVAAILALPLYAAGISVYPETIRLTGRNATQNLAVSAGERDVTDECTFEMANRSLAKVSAQGMVSALADGTGSLTIRWRQDRIVVPVTVTAARVEPQLSFVKDVVPIFTMGGCAGSNCHGSIRGQAGFKLSLFGYEPDLDYQAIQSRIDRDHPEQSLLLRKPTFQVPHGGGVRFTKESLEYRSILEWIARGATYDSAGSPRIASLSVFPEERTLSGAGATQQLIATAKYTDGSTRDVTHLVQYTSNNPDVVQVGSDGRIKAVEAGETAIMVRTLGQAVAARIYVPRPAPPKPFARAPRVNYIDEFVFDKLDRMHIEPSGLSTDSEFLRRVYVDTTGVLPTPQEAEAFLASREADKRSKLIDRLLVRPEFADLWALKFTELFRAGTREAGPKAARIIFDYLQHSFRENKPYDKLVTELLLSQGPHLYSTGSFWNVTFDSNAADHATNISQIFLGTRLECAKCHNHPWEKWTQDDFYGFAAFFARVAIKEIHDDDENEHYYAEEGSVVHPKTKKVVTPKYLEGGYEKDEPEKDIRVPLAAWVTSPKNPFFARAMVNRLWKHYLGRGLVEDVDDFRVTNPPTNPELLDALAADFSGHGYDLRHIIRQMLTSRTYQLSGEPTESGRTDTRNYSHYFMRRLTAEEMLDTISQVTGIQEKFRGFPPGTRAMQVYSAQTNGSYMLAAFGRPNRETICERDPMPDIVQTLHLISGDTINKKIAEWKPEPALDDAQQLNRIILSALARYPTDAERQRIEADLKTRDRRAVFQDLLWAVLNAKEFMFNH